MVKTDDLQPTEVAFTCRDGYVIRGHLWSSDTRTPSGIVIINPATGVLARYYHHFARFLVPEGFDVITYDYRGIGASRPASLRNSGIRWRDWGELDFDAVVGWAHARRTRMSPSPTPLIVVGHSIGGFLPGLAPSATLIDRMLTVGAQYAFHRDYASTHRIQLRFKWHLVMPMLTAVLGYFPGRRLGWLEDLPAGVANEWSRRGADMEHSYPLHERQAILDRFAAVTAPIDAVATSDDIFGTPAALQRTIRYYRSAARTIAILQPAELGYASIGHFGLFHSRHRNDFWQHVLTWLRTGAHPWPGSIIARFDAEHPASAARA